MGLGPVCNVSGFHQDKLMESIAHAKSRISQAGDQSRWLLKNRDDLQNRNDTAPLLQQKLKPIPSCPVAENMLS